MLNDKTFLISASYVEKKWKSVKAKYYRILRKPVRTVSDRQFINAIGHLEHYLLPLRRIRNAN